MMPSFAGAEISRIFACFRLTTSFKPAAARLARADCNASPTLRLPAKEGTIVTNPPYGVRLGELQELAELYPKLGDVLKKKFSGWRGYILSADMRLPKPIRLAASRRTPLFNGPLECRLFEYKMVEGGMRRKKPQA